MVKFSIIEEAYYDFQSDVLDAYVVINKRTGELLMNSSEMDMAQVDEAEARGVDVHGPDWISPPDKLELGLGGRRVALEFTAEHLPDDLDRVNEYFHSRGAYRRFKDFLDLREKGAAWHEFENARTEAALRAWCADNGIELED